MKNFEFFQKKGLTFVGTGDIITTVLEERAYKRLKKSLNRYLLFVEIPNPDL